MVARSQTATFNPLEAVEQLQSLLKSLAPNICPQVLPKGGKYDVQILSNMCRTVKQQQALEELLQQSKRKYADKDDELFPHLIGSFDLEKQVFNLEKVSWMNGTDAIIHEFPRFMELQLENQEHAAQVVSHFLKANGHSDGNIILAEQCFNAAFALQTIVRAFPPFLYAIQGKQLDISESSDVGKLFGPLFNVESKSKTHERKQQQQEQKQRKISSKKRKNQKR